MRKKVINHDILIVLIDINPFFHILHQLHIFYIIYDKITVAAPQELIVDEDEEGDSDIDID